MSLRKVNIVSTSLTNNAGSFTNVTDKRLHIRKVILTMTTTGTLVAADDWSASVDEQPTLQFNVTDSRSHILGGRVKVPTGASGKINLERTLSFNRGDLVLDTDEALFLNTSDIVGAPGINAAVNLFYEA